MTSKHRARIRSGQAGGLSLSALAWAVLALGAISAAPAQAFEIDTGNPDAVLRWDNTVRYNYGVRMKERDPAIIANPNGDDGDRNFARHQAVINRLDLLSEMDYVVDKKYGLRVSGAAWADAAYNNLATDANNPATYNGLGGPNSLSDYSHRFAQGPSGEILDAFLFANVEAGDVPVSVRLGRHTAYWGEGLLLYGAIHGVSYGQYALDIWKSSANPGTEAKELYRPRNGLTLQFQPSSELSVAAQTFFDWEPARIAEAGTYLSAIDASLLGGQRFGPFAQGTMVTPNKTGDWGLSARWSPEWLDGTMGFYARRTSDIANQAWLAFDPGTTTGKYHFSFARNIDIFGASLAKSIHGISVGAELSVRKNMPLVSQNALATAIPGGPFAASTALWALANNGDVPGARGNTAHGVLNLVPRAERELRPLQPLQGNRCLRGGPDLRREEHRCRHAQRHDAGLVLHAVLACRPARGRHFTAHELPGGFERPVRRGQRRLGQLRHMVHRRRRRLQVEIQPGPALHRGVRPLQQHAHRCGRRRPGLCGPVGPRHAGADLQDHFLNRNKTETYSCCNPKNSGP